MTLFFQLTAEEDSVGTLGVPQRSLSILIDWKYEIRYFPNDNTYKCPETINDVFESLVSDLDIVFKWFRDNKMKASLGKFWFIKLITQII